MPANDASGEFWVQATGREVKYCSFAYIKKFPFNYAIISFRKQSLLKLQGVALLR